MLREWAAGEEEQYEIADVAASVPVSMKRKPLSLQNLRRLEGQARSSETRTVIAAALELHRASEKVKRPEFTDEMGEQLADSNPPLPSVLVVFAESDSVEGHLDDEAQSWAEGSPEPNLIIPLNAFDPWSVESAFSTLATACETLQAACRLIDLMPGNEKWVRDSKAQHGSASGDRS